MPNLDTTRAELEKAFQTGWGATTPITFDNTENRDSNGNHQPYVYFYVDYADSNNVCVGAALPETKRQRHIGFIKATIYVPIHGGTGLAYSLADTYKGIMDNKTIVADLFTGPTFAQRGGEDVHGYWSLVCYTDFTSDE